MSMSTYVVGVAPPDDTWKNMKTIYDLCRKSKVKIPKEVLDFFGDNAPDKDGVIVEIKSTKWATEYGVGLEVTIEDLPKHVKVIRFYNSW